MCIDCADEFKCLADYGAIQPDSKDSINDQVRRGKVISERLVAQHEVLRSSSIDRGIRICRRGTQRDDGHTVVTVMEQSSHRPAITTVVPASTCNQDPPTWMHHGARYLNGTRGGTFHEFQATESMEALCIDVEAASSISGESGGHARRVGQREVCAHTLPNI